MYEIEIADTQDHLEVDETRLRQVVERTLENEGVAAARISLAVVDDETIHDINRRFLEHDYPTDVLSFLLECTPGTSACGDDDDDRPGLGVTIEGEVVVSTQTARRAAAEFGWGPSEELLLYAVHGTLHLVGYDDQRSDDRRRMRLREREILVSCGVASPRGDEYDTAPIEGHSGVTE